MHRAASDFRIKKVRDAGTSMRKFAPVNCTASQLATHCRTKARSRNTQKAGLRSVVINSRDQNESEPDERHPRKDEMALQSCNTNGLVVTQPTVEIFPLDAVRRRAITSQSIAAETIQSISSVRIEYHFRAPVHLLVAYQEGARCDGQTVVEGAPPATLRRFARKLTFVPAGYQYHEWHELCALSRLTCFYFDTAKFESHYQTNITNVSFAPRLYFEDESLWHTVLKLADLVEHPALGDPLYLEALGIVIVYELLRLQNRIHNDQPQARGGLAGWQQRIATTYIQEHIAERVKLSTLAQLVHQSPFHFCRAFKQSLGIPPLRYQTKRRIEGAKLLLAKPAMSVTDVGLAVGFSCSSSFATAFRKATGFTPTGYQRSLR
jgi:AraC family transcriptional regulator